ncbi:hypothetical protein SAMN05216420_11929 [Nitrosospira sp. Nl5]|nr:hypothetical protein SAMN05216420_11929 [Nitrosospira sp. Nl5]
MQATDESCPLTHMGTATNPDLIVMLRHAKILPPTYQKYARLNFLHTQSVNVLT